MNITPENQPKTVEIQLQLKEIAERDFAKEFPEPISGRLMEVMPTLMRELARSIHESTVVFDV
jgi:hypothetical protein